MKKQLAVLALGAMLLAQTAVSAQAESNGAVEVLKFPFRLVTGTAGAGVGLVAGGLNGIVETEKKFSDHTFAKASENPLMVPVGIVGAAVAVPVGFVMGAPQGAVDWGKKGYGWWDDMGNK